MENISIGESNDWARDRESEKRKGGKETGIIILFLPESPKELKNDSQPSKDKFMDMFLLTILGKGS